MKMANLLKLRSIQTTAASTRQLLNRVSLTALLAGAILTLISGCAATVVSSGKTSDFNQQISAINIVYVEADLSAKVSLSQSTANKANQQRQELGIQVTQILSDALAKNGIPAQAKSLVPASVPVDASGYRTLFSAAGVPILFINPISAVTTCPSDCFQYRVQAKLIDTDSGKVIWSSTIDLPPKASRFHDFGGVATDFSNTIVTQLKKDAVIK